MRFTKSIAGSGEALAKKSAKDLVLPPADRSASLFRDGTGKYPTQTRLPVEPELAGEFRGFYRTEIAATGTLREYWRPKSSWFKGRAGGSHSGADIFAPPDTFPHETAIVAPADGTLSMRFDAVEPEELGNRARLDLDKTYEGKGVAFVFGHLTRFHGPTHERNAKGKTVRRKVKRGDVIGYAGCTGNADTQGECSSENGEWRVSSGHVHLISEITTPASKTAKGKTEATMERVDPAKTLGWDLQFRTGDDEIDLAKWRTDLRPAAAFQPEMAAGTLAGGARRRWWRESGRRVPLKPPFETIEFDSTRSLERTRDAYRGLKARYASPTFAAKTTKAVLRYMAAHSEVKAHLEQSFDQARQAVEGATTGSALGGPLLRALIAGQYCLWRLMGGSAIAHLNTNRDRNGGARMGTMVECGPGVGGEAWLSAVDGAQAAMQMTTLLVPVEGGSVGPPRHQRRLIVSVSFGAGSLMHATLSGQAEIALGGTAAGAFLGGLRAPFGALVGTLKLAQGVQQRLATDPPDPGARARVLAALDRVRAVLVAASAPLDPTRPDNGGIDRPLTQDEVKTLLGALLDTNLAAFEEAVRRSQKKEVERPIGPRITELRLAGTAEATEVA